MSKLTNDDKLDIIIQYESGVKSSKIAMQHGINVSGVKRIMRKYKEYGLDGISVKKSKRKFDDNFKNEILKLADEGMPLNTIALKYDIDHSTINNWQRKRNEKKAEIVYNKPEEGIGDTMAENENKNISIPLTEEERKELIELRKKNKELEMENEILKKLRALIQQRMEQQKKKK